jgi:hypothetical protein
LSQPAAELAVLGLTVRFSRHDLGKTFLLRYSRLEEKAQAGKLSYLCPTLCMKLIGADPSKSRDLVSTPKRQLTFHRESTEKY